MQDIACCSLDSSVVIYVAAQTLGAQNNHKVVNYLGSLSVAP